ncbi:hypothetical protein Efla_002496 [Eimeria flavescens]
MTTLTVMVGGCGNYLGCELFELLYAEAQRASASKEGLVRDSLIGRFFKVSGQHRGGEAVSARSLLIDMEAKVVQNCLLRHPASQATPGASSIKLEEDQERLSWCWDPKFAYWQQGGCGNNWAFGHELQGPSHGEALEGLIAGLAEESDIVSAVLLLHSVAGGTGSGVGAYMTELCADLLPKSSIASCCVWPYDAEVATQSFNAALSLAALQRDRQATTIFFFENARCTATLERHGAASSATSGVALSTINRFIARDLAGCSLLPSIPLASSTSKAHLQKPSNQATAKSFSRPARPPEEPVSVLLARDSSGWCRRCPLREMVAAASPHPAFKLLTCRYLPQSLLPQATADRLGAYNFTFLLRQMQRMFARADTLDLHVPPGYTSSARQRQDHYAEVQQRIRKQDEPDTTRDGLPNAAVAASCCLRGPDLHKLKQSALAEFRIPMWPHALEPVQVSAHSSAAFGEPSSMGLTTNCRTPLPALRRTLQAGRNMLHAGAFVHHFEQFGIGTLELSAALEQLEEIVEAYAALKPG